MADNIQLNAGTGGDALAAKDMGTSKHQRVLNEALDSTGIPQDVSATNPMPVTGIELEQILMVLQMLKMGAGASPGDFQGRTRVALESGTLPVLTQLTKLIGYGNMQVDASIGLYATPQAIRQGIVVS